MTLNYLKNLSQIKFDIIKENRANKLISDDINKELEKICKPVIEPLKSVTEDTKIEYNSQLKQITE